MLELDDSRKRRPDDGRGEPGRPLVQGATGRLKRKPAALRPAAVVVARVEDASDLLIEPEWLAATVRS